MAPFSSPHRGGLPRRQYSAGGETHLILAFELAGGWKDIKLAVTATVLQFLMGGGGSFSSGGPGAARPAPAARWAGRWIKCPAACKGAAEQSWAASLPVALAQAALQAAAATLPSAQPDVSAAACADSAPPASAGGVSALR